MDRTFIKDIGFFATVVLCVWGIAGALVEVYGQPGRAETLGSKCLASLYSNTPICIAEAARIKSACGAEGKP